MKKGKYLFFDIECSNGHNICSFGFVLTDEKMHILTKKDIVINPENRFILSPVGKRPKIELAYPQEFFYKQNNFSYFYPEIRKLLTQKYIILGHSIQSDIHFLAFACKRYSLPQINFVAYDTQKIFKILYNQEHVESLEKILEHLEISRDGLTLHRSCDDAHATMLVAKELAYQNDCTIEQLIEKIPESRFSSKITLNKRVSRK